MVCLRMRCATGRICQFRAILRYGEAAGATRLLCRRPAQSLYREPEPAIRGMRRHLRSMKMVGAARRQSPGGCFMLGKTLIGMLAATAALLLCACGAEAVDEST